MIGHWQAPDPIGDLCVHVFRADRAAPIRVDVRPELLERLRVEHGRQVDGQAQHAGAWAATIGNLAGVPIVVDRALPFYPGFEIHRVPPERKIRTCD